MAKVGAALLAPATAAALQGFETDVSILRGDFGVRGTMAVARLVAWLTEAATAVTGGPVPDERGAR
jgi:hypothetical protein